MKRSLRTFTILAIVMGVAASAPAIARDTFRVGDLPQDSDGQIQEALPLTDHLHVGDDDHSRSSDELGDTYLKSLPDAAERLSPKWGTNTCSCESGRCGGRCNQQSCRSQNDTWLEADLLLWFPEIRDAPPLAARADSGAVPSPGQAGYQVLFGEEIDSGLAPGFRLDAGKWFNNGNLGLGGRIWFLSGNDENFSISSTGDPSLAVPYFDVIAGAESGNVTALTNPPAALALEGRIDIITELDILATEVYGRHRFCSGRDFNVDFLGGFSFFRIEDNLLVNSQVTRADGLIRRFNDKFNTRNKFHGGQLGLETTARRGRWTLRTLTKAHLGNMNQRLLVNGTSQSELLGVPGSLQTFNGGLLTLDNRGIRDRDKFTFVPEVNVKLSHQFRNYVSFGVGYSFIYWNNVALAGQQIDRNINTTGLLTNAVTVGSPARKFETSGFFVHGIDFGMSLQY